jgi:hypothetical protein
MKKEVFLVLLVLAITALLPQGQAYCSQECARVGDTMAVVLNNCGNPTWVETRREWRWLTVPPGVVIDGWYVANRPVVVQVPVDIVVWTYDLGKTRFMRIFAFENGFLTSISTGGYGH